MYNNRKFWLKKSIPLIALWSFVTMFCGHSYADREQPIKVYIEGVLKDPKSSDERKNQGAIICLNDDDDNYVAESSTNKPDYQEDGPNTNEDDLQKIILHVDILPKAGASVTLNVTPSDKIKIWKDKSKTGTPLVSSATPTVNWTAEQFKNQVNAKEFYVEGVKRSDSPLDVSIKLTYKPTPASPASAQPVDVLKYTVVQLFLDVDNDGALVDDNDRFWPGRDLSRNQSLQIEKGTDKITSQQLHMIVAPFAANMKVEVNTELSEISNYPGICMNRGRSKGDDFSFDPTSDKSSLKMTLNSGKMNATLYCKDFAAKGKFRANILRSGKALTQCLKTLPVDSDNDLLPDVFEVAYGSVGGVLILDKNKTHTSPTVSDSEVDVDGTPVTPGINTKVSYNPPLGRLGDGFSAFEEYRGFETRATQNFNSANDIERDDMDADRSINVLDPNIKDLFVRATVFLQSTDFLVAGPPIEDKNLGIGWMTDWEEHGLHVWRLTNNELIFATGIVNYNRTSGPPQSAVRIVEGNAGGDLGLAIPAGLRTGDDGILQSVRTPNDRQLIAQFHGLKDAVVISAGNNGIIDPPYDHAKDALDAVANRITDGGDGKLDTVTSSYVTPGNDRVRGVIHAPENMPLSKETVEKMNSGDILRGYIEGTAQKPLDPATVESVVTGKFDELNDVVLDFSNVAGPVVANEADTLNGKIISPINPVTKLNDGFQTAVGTGFFRGSIREGADQVLDARPSGTDRVVGTIEEGPDLNLKSRPQNNAEYVTGFIDGGPVGPGSLGKLNPRLNNAHAKIHDSGNRNAADDDEFDEVLNVINAGDDGVCNTLKVDGSDDADRIQPGYGEPHSTALLPDASPNSDGNLKSIKSGDDEFNEAQEPDNTYGQNQSPNEHEPVEINIPKLEGRQTGPDLFDDQTEIEYARTDSKFSERLSETMGHEGSHACHLSHWFQGRGTIQIVTEIENGAYDPIVNPNAPKTVPITAKAMVFADAHGPLLQAEKFRKLTYGGFPISAKNPVTGALERAWLITYGINDDATPGGTGSGHPGWTNMASNGVDPAPHKFDSIDLDQLRLHLRR